jgi:ABC-type Zn2+ transport system substrate-binding protein/surface adhesin
MANKNDKNNIRDERIEDTTLYGEFVSSFHQWRTPDGQRKVARHLEEVTEELSPDSRKKVQEETKRSN